MKSINTAVIWSYTLKVVPVVLAILTTRGIITQEQSAQVIPILDQCVVAGGAVATVVTLIVAFVRSLKSHGTPAPKP